MKVQMTKDFDSPARFLFKDQVLEVDDEFGEVLLKHGAKRLDAPKRAPVKKAVRAKATYPETLSEDKPNDDQA